MKILFLGDVVGRSGRDAITSQLPKIRKELLIDFAIVNADNAASGFGVTPNICKDFFAAGADVVTGGDHIWDQKEITSYIDGEKRLLRPHNFPDKTPGTGTGEFATKDGKKVMVIHLLGQVFHKEHTNCPFATVDRLLEGVNLKTTSVIVDFHAEATSEKMAMGKYLDGRVSMVVGSHTHVPTNDARVLPKGTAYQTDGGMCGDYDSVIGFDSAAPLERFLTKVHRGSKLEPAQGAATLCGLLAEIDYTSGLATSCKAFTWHAL